MELVLEVVIYLLVVLGLITVCFTFFNKFNFLGPIITNEVAQEITNVNEVTYKREKKDNEKITMNIRYKNISEEELSKVKESIEKGLYNNIIDLVDEVNYFEKSVKKKKG